MRYSGCGKHLRYEQLHSTELATCSALITICPFWRSNPADTISLHAARPVVVSSAAPSLHRRLGYSDDPVEESRTLNLYLSGRLFVQIKTVFKIRGNLKQHI
jgi:hypothetical protein